MGPVGGEGRGGVCGGRGERERVEEGEWETERERVEEGE